MLIIFLSYFYIINFSFYCSALFHHVDGCQLNFGMLVSLLLSQPYAHSSLSISLLFRTGRSPRAESTKSNYWTNLDKLFREEILSESQASSGSDDWRDFATWAALAKQTIAEGERRRRRWRWARNWQPSKCRVRACWFILQRLWRQVKHFFFFLFIRFWLWTCCRLCLWPTIINIQSVNRHDFDWPRIFACKH